MTTGLRLDGIGVRFGNVQVLHDIGWALEPGELGVLLGPSGCGKSTLLRVIAGQIEPDPGAVVETAGRDLTGVAAEHRGVVLVSQTTRLFPHLDVARNVGFGLRMRGLPRSVRRERVSALLELVGLPGLGSRDPQTLSGGQAQRVALARALIVEPSVLLLDEPFAQLDPDTRAEMQEVVRTLQAELRTTTLCVTHDRQEALTLADTLAVMLDGRIAAAGDPQQLMINPPTSAVARFLGATNDLPGCVTNGAIDVPGVQVTRHCPVEGSGSLLLRPESIVLRAAPAPTGAREPATVLTATYRGTHQEVTVGLPSGGRLVAHVDLSTRWLRGDPVEIAVLDGHGTWFPDASAQRP